MSLDLLLECLAFLFQISILNRNSFPPINPTVAMDKTTYSGKLLLTFTPVTAQLVLEILQKTTPKSCDLDPIPTKLLYENLDGLLPTIISIINTSLASGLVPPDFKPAIVKPLLKKPSFDKNVLKNYHRISNLPFLSKILEKVVLHQLLAHLQENNLCNPFQSACRTIHSTETALLCSVNNLLNVWTKIKSLFYSYWIFQLHLILSITRFFFHVSKLPLASALPLSSGFDHTFWTEISVWLLTILLPLHLFSCLVFHRAQCWDQCCLFCTLLHFQTS